MTDVTAVWEILARGIDENRIVEKWTLLKSVVGRST